MLALRNSFGLLIRSHSLSYYIYIYMCVYISMFVFLSIRLEFGISWA